MVLDPELCMLGQGPFTSSPKKNLDFLPPDLNSGAITEDITDIDEPSKSDTTNQKNPLMSLLSGKQTQKKKLRRNKAPKLRELRENPEKNGEGDVDIVAELTILASESKQPLVPDIQTTDSTTLTEEISEVTDTSFDAEEFERKLQKQRNLVELEKKVFKESKSISALDFLKREKKAKSDEPEQEEISLVSSDESLVHIPDSDQGDIEIVEESANPQISAEEDPVKLLEEKYGKRTAAKDLFSAFAPKRQKNRKGEWTLKVKLRLAPTKLAVIKEFENPLKTKGNTTENGNGQRLGSLMSLMKKKESVPVTLKVPSSALKEVQRNSNPLYTKSSGNQNGRPAKNVFAMMMQTARSAEPKLTPMQKLKELEPPSIPRQQMHVKPEETSSSEKLVLPEIYLGLPLKGKAESKWELLLNFSADDMDSILSSGQSSHTTKLSASRSEIPKADLVTLRAPLAFTNTAHKRIYEEFVLQDPASHDFLNWPQKFQPPHLEAALMTKQNTRFLQLWFDNAFAILSTQSTKVPRNVKMREQAKRQRKREANMAFIVDDDYTDGEETEEDTFVPVLIIHGETGLCKSSLVYAALGDKNGYVYEINAGQQRSRRDLYGSLKEFCTTQIIHNSSTEVTTAKKGVVLFEDCDILFDQDKTFWTVVQDVINFSKRPIVITVTDTSVIPRNIWDLAGEQNSIVELQNTDREAFEQYLWLCAMSFGYDLGPNLQKQIVAECKGSRSFDLRLALMKCQWYCSNRKATDGITTLELEIPDSKEADSESLDTLAHNLDMLSVSDVIGSNTTSSILHDCHTNELLDIYVIHDSELIKQSSLEHEVNIGTELRALTKVSDLEFPIASYSHNYLRQLVNDFISSRRKKIPKFMQDLGFRTTRSRSGSENDDIPETQLLPETLTCYSMSPRAFTLELAPMARLWSRLQRLIFAMDKKYELEGVDTNLELHLNWRKFYHNVDEILETSPLRLSQDQV